MNEVLDGFLARSGIAARAEARTWVPLTGGVSSEIWRVEFADGRRVCVKRALSRLRVAAEWLAPLSRNASEWAWIQFAAKVVPCSVPRPFAHDAAAGLFAMEYLPVAHYPVWKTRLLAGHVDVETASRVGTLVGRLHAASAHRDDLKRAFDTTATFSALRLEPYLTATGVRHPDIAGHLQRVARTTADTRIALVHGDVSPKNILVGPSGPVLIDAECAWYGDAAFDVAFCLNHMLLKSMVVPGASDRLRQCFDALVDAYFHEAQEVDERGRLEERAAALLPALLLARIDGKSPVEYLDQESQRERVRRAAIPLIQSPARTLDEVARQVFASIPGLP